MSFALRQAQLRAIWTKARDTAGCPACGAAVAHACQNLRGEAMLATHSARVRAAGLTETSTP